MKRNKENALENFVEMIMNSWTYNKLTNEEKIRFEKTFNDVRLDDSLKGTYSQRWEILQTIYMAFLNGVGYSGFDWRKDI